MSLRSVIPTRRATADKLMATVAQHSLGLHHGRIRLFPTLRDDVRQAQNDAVVVLRLEGALFVDANLRGGDEIAMAGTRRVQIEEDEPEIESGGRWRRSSHRDRLG